MHLHHLDSQAYLHTSITKVCVLEQHQNQRKQTQELR